MPNFRRGLQKTKRYWLIGLVLFLSNLLLSAKIQAKTLYVSDTTLTANVRTGPSFENRIIAMLQSGTKVTLVREEGGWSEVALADGRRAWILKNYLSDRPPWRETAQKLTAENQSLQSQVASLEQSKQTLSHENKKLMTELQDRSQKLDQLEKANKNMKTSYNLRWFLGGAGVLFAGWILGFWMGRMRRRSYSERYRL
jgi:SH3 domain protein